MTLINSNRLTGNDVSDPVQDQVRESPPRFPQTRDLDPDCIQHRDELARCSLLNGKPSTILPHAM